MRTLDESVQSDVHTRTLNKKFKQVQATGSEEEPWAVTIQVKCADDKRCRKRLNKANHDGHRSAATHGALLRRAEPYTDKLIIACHPGASEQKKQKKDSLKAPNVEVIPAS
jgi:hypothetical protein